MTKERNTYIDMLRGIAALSIVAIHTAFWGGVSYTPEWFRSLTLILDVPFFFFLSGWGASLHKRNVIKTTKGLGRIWLQWIFFISIIAIICYLSKYTQYEIVGITGVKDLIDNYMFLVSVPGIPVIKGSIWFMPYYFVVILVNTIVVACLDKLENSVELEKWYGCILGMIFLWIASGNYFFDLDFYFVFYSFFWMLGYNKRFIAIRNLKQLVSAELVVMVGFLISSIWMQIGILDVQNAKFPPSVKYGFYSMITILLAIYLETVIKKHNRLLVHIGKNAIYYFFAQGVGSSINYYFVNVLPNDNWLIKFVITYFINVILTIGIAECLAFTYKKVSEFGKKIMENGVKIIASGECK